MKGKLRIYLYGAYELFLSLGAIIIGTKMILNFYGLYSNFDEFPPEWESTTIFSSWLYPGIIAICIFGLGNMISVVYIFMKNYKLSFILGVFMGSLLFISVIIQIILLGTYLPSIEFLILGGLQIGFGSLLQRKIKENFE